MIVTRFLGEVLGLGEAGLHRLEDPLGAASINIFPPGTAHNWHFDEVDSVSRLYRWLDVG